MWRYGQDPRSARRGVLEVLQASDGALRASWAIPFKVGSLRFSPDGRFAAFGSADTARKGVAVEVYFVGEEVWD